MHFGVVSHPDCVFALLLFYHYFPEAFQMSTYHLLDLRASGAFLTDKTAHPCLPVIFSICVADV